METVYVGIGSNIDPEVNIPEALRLLKEQVRVVALSTFYRTEPVGCPGSPSFVNGVARAETEIDPRALKFDVLREIERTLGRARTEDKYSPRTIDLDIIAYGDFVIHESDMEIPDPDVLSRVFVAAPLFELDPGLVIPGISVSLAEVVKGMHIDSMVPLHDLTSALRKEILDEP